MRDGHTHGLYPYSPISERGPLRWPGGRVAVIVMLNVEHFEVRDSKGKLDVKGFTQTDYGNRVGIWRVLDAMDQLGIPGTVALNSSVCEHYPQIVRALQERGDEFIGHGITNSEDLDELSNAEAGQVIARAVNTVAEFTGERVRGWLGTGLAETDTTLSDLIANGIEYVCDWGLADDQPFRMDNGLYVMPYSMELNDKRHFSGLGNSADFAKYVVESFDVLYEEGATQGRVMCVSLHPFLVGTPNRIGDLRRALAHIVGHEEVWWARAAEVLDTFKGLVGDSPPGSTDDREDV